MGSDSLSVVNKAFPVVRHGLNKKPGAQSVVGGNLNVGPVKLRKKKTSKIDDDELSELSK